MQNSWSRTLGVNLLAAGYHWPERAKLGSGIYRGATDLLHSYIYDTESSNKMVVSELETVATVEGTHPNTRRFSGVRNLRATIRKAPRRDHLIHYDDLSNYTQVLLAHDDRVGGDAVQYAKACHDDGLCCDLSYLPTGTLNYSLLAYSGVVVEGEDYQIYCQICAVVWCPTNDVTTCAYVSDGIPEPDQFGAFTITGTFSTSYVYPVMIRRNLDIVGNDHFSDVSDGVTYTMSTQDPTDSVLSAGYFARWYERDP